MNPNKKTLRKKCNTIGGDNLSFTYLEVKYLVCNFITFGTTCVNQSLTRKQYTNHRELAKNKKPQQVRQDEFFSRFFGEDVGGFVVS
jgi:hypothetical protein